MLLLTLFVVAGTTLGESSMCASPGVFALNKPNTFLACRYNEEGDLISQILPCPNGSEYSSFSARCENTNSRQKRDLSDSSESKESISSKSNESIESNETLSESDEKLAETTESVIVTEISGATDITEVPTNASEAPVTSTLAPVTSTHVPVTSTLVPVTSTLVPVTSTLIPVTSTLVPVTSSPAKPIECRYPGVMCTTCSQAALCVGTGTMKNNIPFISPVATVECLQNQVCVDLVGCVSDQNQLCTLGQFICTDEGMFPDPYDCKIFHSCVLLNGLFKQDDIKCLDGAYSAKTGTCGYPLNSPTCINKPVPSCRAEFEMGALPNNPNIYYICIKKGSTLTPSLFKCPAGLKFTTALFSCV